MCLEAKSNYYSNIVEDLKESAPGQWYSKLKRMASHDEIRGEQVSVEEIEHLTNKEQAEIIADKFSQISNKYEPINAKDIDIESSKNNTPVTVLEP